MTLEAKISKLRQQAADLTAKKAGAEHELRVAVSNRDAALKALLGEFGAEDIEQARQLLESTQTDLAAECRKIEEALSEAGKGPA